jgi:hypothetical protein
MLLSLGYYFSRTILEIEAVINFVILLLKNELHLGSAETNWMKVVSMQNDQNYE